MSIFKAAKLRKIRFQTKLSQALVKRRTLRLMLCLKISKFKQISFSNILMRITTKAKSHINNKSIKKEVNLRIKDTKKKIQFQKEKVRF